MSYILNALKQSESQRSRGDIPHVDTLQDIAGSGYRPTPGRSLWRWWALLASAALLLLLAWLLAGRLDVPPETALPASAAVTPAAPLVAPADNPSAPPAALQAPASMAAPAQAPGLEHLQDASGLRVQLDDVEPARAPVVLELPVPAGRLAVPAPGGVTSLAAAPSRTPAEIPQRRDADEAVPADPRLRDVAHWKGLPSGVQRQLRELGINAHVYSSDATARFIRAGGRTLREGDRLNAELRLQFITRDGIVVGYQERKYWMRLN